MSKNKIVGVNISSIIQEVCDKQNIDYKSFNLENNKDQINKDIKDLAKIRKDIEIIKLKLNSIKQRYLRLPDIDKLFDEVLKEFDGASHKLIIEANKLAKQK